MSVSAQTGQTASATANTSTGSTATGATATGTTGATTGNPPATTTGPPPVTTTTGQNPPQTTATATTAGTAPPVLTVAPSIAPLAVSNGVADIPNVYGFEFFIEARKAVDMRRKATIPVTGTNPLIEGAGPSDITKTNVNLPVPERYQLGPGDQLSLRVSSPVQVAQTYDLRIDPTGTILIPATNTRVVLRGQTLAQATLLVTREVKQYLRDATVDIQLTALRTITVRILGDAYAPGTYELPSVITLFNALYAAGGPADGGSLRAIELRRTSGGSRRIDLYDMFIRGTANADVPLQPGDIIFIPPAVSRVTVKGEVRRVAVFELLNGEGLKDAIQFAGGAKPTGVTQRVSVDSVKPGVARQLIDANLLGKKQGDNPRLYDGDSVEIYSIRPLISNYVEIQGAVDQPRKYAFAKGARVSDLVTYARGTLPEAELTRADLFRLNKDGSTTLIPINLRNAIQKVATDNVELVAEDRLVVYTLGDVSRLPGRRISVVGAVQRPGPYIRSNGMTLRDLLIQAGGLLPTANDRVGILQRMKPDGMPGPFLRIDLSAAIKNERGANVELLDDDILTVNTQKEAVYSPDQTVEISGAVQRPGMFTLSESMKLTDLVDLAGGVLPTAATSRVYIQRVNPNGTQGPMSVVDLSKAIAGDSAMNLVLAPKDKVSVFAQDEIQFRQQEVFALTGAFLKPGQYPLASGMTLKDAIQLAGGFLPNAAETIEVSHAYATIGTPVDRYPVALIMAEDPKANVVLKPGDSITLPTRKDVVEKPRIVYIGGSVKYPGPYALSGANDRLSNLISRAGGFQERAFPEGAEFARDPRFLSTVKQQTLQPRLVETLRQVSELEYQRASALADIDRLRIVFTAGAPSAGSIPGLGAGSSSGTTVNAGAALDAGLAKAFSGQAVTPARTLGPGDILPGGNLNVNLAEAMSRPGSSKDLILQDGDVITIPERPSTVAISGAVVLPSAVLYEPGKSIQHYIDRAGGVTIDAATDSVLIIRANGALIRYKRGVRVELGDNILVPTKVMAVRLRQEASTIDKVTSVATSAALTIAIIRSLSR